MASKPKPLTRSSDYTQIAKLGRRLKPAPWIHLNILASDDLQSYCGITVSGKVGPSVIRNRLKRWVRNCVRSEKWPDQFIAKKVVFVFRPQSNESFYKQLKFKQFVEVYRKL